MKMIIAMLGLFLAIGSVQAQTTDQKRIDAIWSAADDRIAQQLDVWFDAGDFPLCVQLLRVQYDMHPDDYQVATNLGWMLENIEEWDDAVATYQQYRRENPRDPDNSLPLAQYWTMKRQFDKVPPLLEGHLTVRSHPNNYRLLAHAYERLGKFKEAAATWKAYLAFAPKDAAAKANLARVEQKMVGGSGR